MEKFIKKSIWPSFLCRRIILKYASDKEDFELDIEMSPFDVQFDLENDKIVLELNSIMFKKDIKSVRELSREYH